MRMYEDIFPCKTGKLVDIIKEDYSKSGVYEFQYKGESIYIGQTNNVVRRLREHAKVDHNLEKTWEKLFQGDGYNKAMKLRIEFYWFLKQHMEDINVIVSIMPIERLNTMEEKWIKEKKPRFNYAGVHCAYIPVKR